MCFLCTAPIWDGAHVKNRDDTPPCTTSRYLRSVLNLKITNFLQNRIISLWRHAEPHRVLAYMYSRLLPCTLRTAAVPRGMYSSSRRASHRVVICMSEASSRARGVRACVPYSRTALYGFPTAKCDNLLVWRREMRSEGVANRPNGQRFWDQKTSLCLLHLPTVLQRPF